MGFMLVGILGVGGFEMGVSERTSFTVSSSSTAGGGGALSSDSGRRFGEITSGLVDLVVLVGMVVL